jgi:hypothetical protein
MGLLTHALRLSLAAVVSVLAFLALEVPLGYVTIQFQFGVQPLVARSEFSSLLLGLTVAVPLMFGLSILGMTLAWSTCRTYGIPALVVHGCVCGAIVAVAATLEQIPRSFGEWLSCLLPVLVVVVNYWLILLRAPRAEDRS